MQSIATPHSMSTILEPHGMVRHASNVTEPEPNAEASADSGLPKF